MCFVTTVRLKWRCVLAEEILVEPRGVAFTLSGFLISFGMLAGGIFRLRPLQSSGGKSAMPPNLGCGSKNQCSARLFRFLFFGSTTRICALGRFLCFFKGIDGCIRPYCQYQLSAVSVHGRGGVSGETPSPSHFGRRPSTGMSIVTLRLLRAMGEDDGPSEWNQCHRRVEGQNCVPSRSSFPSPTSSPEGSSADSGSLSDAGISTNLLYNHPATP